MRIVPWPTSLLVAVMLAALFGSEAHRVASPMKSAERSPREAPRASWPRMRRGDQNVRPIRSEHTTITAPEMVRVNVAVFDRAGRAVTDLRQEEFTVYEMGHPQRLERFLPPRAPLRLIALVDTSPSVAFGLKPALDALVEFFLNLGPHDEVSVISFGSRVTLETDFTFNPDRLREVITRLDASRDPADVTKLYDAVAIALERLREQEGTRTAVLLVSDGRDRGSSEARREETLALARESFVTIHPIFITPRASSKNDYLEQLAETTGGETYRTERTLDRDLAELARRLRFHYVLGYVSSHAPDPKRIVPIEVRVARPEVTLFATRRYRPFVKRGA